MTIWKKLKALLSKEKLEITSDWVDIYTGSEVHLIQLYKVQLELNNIPYRVIDKRDTTYNNFGFIHLLVQSEDCARAMQVLDLHE